MQILSHLYPSMLLGVLVLPISCIVGLKRPWYCIGLSLFVAYTFAYPVFQFHRESSLGVALALAILYFVSIGSTLVWSGLYLFPSHELRLRNRTYFFGTAGVSPTAVKKVRAEKRAEAAQKNVDPAKRGWIRVNK